MRHRRIVILGGTGFIGRHLAARLVARGAHVVVPTRRSEHARDLKFLPTLEVLQADLHDSASFTRVLAGSDAVVNLIGILHGGRGIPYGEGFARAHVALPRRLVEAMGRAQVHRLVHVSALGVQLEQTGPSMYLRSKADGERAVEQSLVDWTIFRPSVVFGPDDRFLNLFAQLQALAPLVPLAGARCRFQPVYVDDVVSAIVAALEDSNSIGQTIELAGPEVFTLAQLVGWVGRVSGHPRPILALPDLWARLQAWVFEHLPGPPLISRDNLDSMRVDNVASGRVPCFPPTLGVVPQALSALAPTWLAPQVAARHGAGQFIRLRDRGHG
jgi:NADH dehydrogenase